VVERGVCGVGAGVSLLAKVTKAIPPTFLIFSGGIILLVVLIAFNSSSTWIQKNGGLASWVQAVGSLVAIIAISLPVLLERRLSVKRARSTVLASAKMAVGLMTTVANRAFDSDARFSEWWVPQWHIIDEVMASCPIHEIDSPIGLEAFVTIRELYGRMKAWDEDSDEGWPRSGDGGIQSYVGNLCMNASHNLTQIEAEFSR
jgi:hypothetical protein